MTRGHYHLLEEVAPHVLHAKVVKAVKGEPEVAVGGGVVLHAQPNWALEPGTKVRTSAPAPHTGSMDRQPPTLDAAVTRAGGQGRVPRTHAALLGRGACGRSPPRGPRSSRSSFGRGRSRCTAHAAPTPTPTPPLTPPPTSTPAPKTRTPKHRLRVTPCGRNSLTRTKQQPRTQSPFAVPAHSGPGPGWATTAESMPAGTASAAPGSSPE
jgi:hypothetical protein